MPAVESPPPVRCVADAGGVKLTHYADGSARAWAAGSPVVVRVRPGVDGLDPGEVAAVRAGVRPRE